MNERLGLLVYEWKDDGRVSAYLPYSAAVMFEYGSPEETEVSLAAMGYSKGRRLASSLRGVKSLWTWTRCSAC